RPLTPSGRRNDSTDWSARAAPAAAPRTPCRPGSRRMQDGRPDGVRCAMLVLEMSGHGAPGKGVSMLEQFFATFRANIVGVNHRLDGPYGSRPLVYADWTASGRRYGPIERRMAEEFGPLVGNTHSESSTTGMAMTRAYQRAQALLKAHVHAGPDDVIITQGS